MPHYTTFPPNKWIQRDLNHILAQGFYSFEYEDYCEIFRTRLNLPPPKTHSVELWQGNARFDLLYFYNENFKASGVISKQTMYFKDGTPLPFTDDQERIKYMDMCEFIKQTLMSPPRTLTKSCMFSSPSSPPSSSSF